MNGLAYYDGVFGKRDEIRIPLSDRAIFFGDAVYEAAVGTERRIFLLEEHIERFYNNIKKLHIPFTLEADELEELLYRCVRKAGFSEYFLYFQCSRSSDTRRHSYLSADGYHFLVTVDYFTVSPPSRDLRLISAEDLRYRYCDIKTVNLLPAVLASGKAEESGCDEAVLYRGEWVTECAHSNISILKDGRIYSHPTDSFILPGISRRQLSVAARELGIPFAEERFTLSDCFSADEIFVTSTSRLCSAASELDGIRVGGRGGDIREQILNAIYSKYILECR